MSNFIIQTNDLEIAYDFSFHLIQAIKYQNWYHNERLHFYSYDYEIEENTISFIDRIPVGSVEFVLDFYKKYYGIDNIKPINIPSELMNSKYLKRNISNIESDKPFTFYGEEKPSFVKDNAKIKGFADVVNYNKEFEAGEYITSEIVDIDSEWRGFVFNGELLDLRCYAGKFDLFPNVGLVKEMVSVYRNSPKAYTIDVGVNNGGTFIIECHQFFSCGLYGFLDYRVLPQMFSSCYKEIIRKKR